MSSRTSPADKLPRTPFRTRRRRSLQSEPETADFGEVRVTRTGVLQRSRAAARAGSELDSAQYNCGCGFVFAAPVLTSVACPHCGDAQAW